jgi:hypothetical protein
MAGLWQGQYFECHRLLGIILENGEKNRMVFNICRCTMVSRGENAQNQLRIKKPGKLSKFCKMPTSAHQQSTVHTFQCFTLEKIDVTEFVKLKKEKTTKNFESLFNYKWPSFV